MEKSSTTKAYLAINGTKIICARCGGMIAEHPGMKLNEAGKPIHINSDDPECNPYLNYYGPGKPID